MAAKAGAVRIVRRRLKVMDVVFMMAGGSSLAEGRRRVNWGFKHLVVVIRAWIVVLLEGLDR
jgi:hypothetical protein